MLVLCLLLTAEKPGRYALDYELLQGRLLENLKIPDHVIAMGFVLQLITDFYLHVCEVNDYLGLGSELSALDPWFHWARSLPALWRAAFVFSTRRVAP